MIEDFMDYNGSNGIYKQQPPLRPPPMSIPTSVRASVSPRFDNLMTQSSSIPWAPTPLDRTQYDRTSAEPLATNHTFTKSSDMWTNNNAHTKSSDMWTNNNPHTKSSDAWLNNNPHIKSSDPWSGNNAFTKTTDTTLMSNNSSNAPMIKSSNKTCGCITDRCSPRCKLGILGFIIGFLAVGIAVAVVLVLWLRK